MNFIKYIKVETNFVLGQTSSPNGQWKILEADMADRVSSREIRTVGSGR